MTEATIDLRVYADTAFPLDRQAESSSLDIEVAVTGLAKSFVPGRPVFSDVSLSIPRGESLALIGPNGAGKSTLLRCLLRLIEPDAGQVRMAGRNIGAMNRAELRSLRASCGFVFQKHNLVPRLSALSNVVQGALARDGYNARCWFQWTAPRRAREEALDCLDRVGLADIAERRADQLSGGQSQRVAVARALMQRPRFLFADEPAASLDPAAGEEVMGVFANLARLEGLTLIFTSHDLQHALHYADRVVLLRDGGVALDAPTAHVTFGELRAYYDRF